MIGFGNSGEYVTCTPMVDDSELLLRYCRDRSEAAFTELVGRYVNLVYFAALRQVGGDAHRAEDVSQAVFTQLARKATALASRASIAGWLYNCTRFIAARTMRAEQRRLNRERIAHTMLEIDADPTPPLDWTRLGPVVDEVLHALNERDREVVLLRYFQDNSFVEISSRLGLSADAARFRLVRALEKIRAGLARRGISSTAAALALALAQQAGAATPPGLAVSVSGAALASAAGGSALLSSTLGGLAGSFGIAAILAITTLGTAIYEFSASQRAQSELSAANHEVRAESAQLQALELKAQAAKQTRSKRTTKAQASKPTSSHAWDPRAEGQKFLATYPNARAMMMQASVPGILAVYAPFMRSANLTPGQIEQFENLIASTWVDNTGLRSTPPQGPLVVKPNFDQLSQILGAQVAQKYETYEQSMRYPYQFMESAAAAAAMEGPPLSDEQIDKIARIISDDTGPYQRVWASDISPPVNGNGAAGAVDWDAVIAKVRSVLPTSQFSIIQNELERMPYVGGHGREEQSQAQSGP